MNKNQDERTKKKDNCLDSCLNNKMSFPRRRESHHKIIK